MGLLLISAAVPALLAEDSENKAATEPAPEPRAQQVSTARGTGEAGRRIFIDPATGQRVVPSAEERQRLAPAVLDTHAGLTQEFRSDGSVGLRGGNFRQFLQLEIGADGKMHFFHAPQPANTGAGDEQ